MASENLRKKWGTIFMGEREATMDQIDAMQEPILRERFKKEQQHNYLERVRQRATERARQILGEAYAERQSVLEKAKAEIEAERKSLHAEIQKLNAAAVARHGQAEEELNKARTIREQAERIREQAHEEGFQAGMEQAGEELKEFRAEIGQGLAGVLRAIDAQFAGLSNSWREALVELTRTAVSTATGWLLKTEHEAILRSLVLEAVGLLENRTTVTVRVNPADEAVVSDMFKAAREKAPELRQWIVNGDESIEPGGLVAESFSGSVDCRREHFTALVKGILEHLALPDREAEEAGAAVHAQAEAAARQFVPPPQAPPQESVAEESLENATEPAATSGSDSISDMGPTPSAACGDALSAQPVAMQEEDDAPPFQETLSDGSDADENVSSYSEINDAAAVETPEHPEQPSPPPVPQEQAPPSPEAAPDDTPDVPEAWLPPLGDDLSEGSASSFSGDDAPDAALPSEAAVQGRSVAPSLAELEEELFPLDEEQEREILSNGGLLPGAEGGRD